MNLELRQDELGNYTADGISAILANGYDVMDVKDGRPGVVRVLARKLFPIPTLSNIYVKVNAATFAELADTIRSLKELKTRHTARVDAHDRDGKALITSYKALCRIYATCADALNWARLMSVGGGPPTAIKAEEAERAAEALSEAYHKVKEENAGLHAALRDEWKGL